MRISSLLLFLAVTACGGPEGDASSLEEAEAKARADAADNGQVDCALGGETQFTRSCTVERTVSDGDLILTIRDATGGFRRFRVMKDGSGLTTADGAEPATIRTLGNNAVEVQVGLDRYRLPATIKGSAK